MQPKVSMIISCYNKATYLADMLTTVLSQLWDNIEVIIVNDGSTDESRKIICVWEKKLLQRGYEVIIIDQTNIGVAYAVKAGITKASGEYVCIPDADDCLANNYVSAMASLLSSKPDIEFVACGMARRSERGGEVTPIHHYNTEIKKENMLMRLLLDKFGYTVCRYMFRYSYLRQVGLPNSITTEPPVSQEPQIIIPIIHGNGKFAYVDDILYTYNSYVQGILHGYKKDLFESRFKHYHSLQLQTIAKLPISEKRKIELASVIGMGAVLNDSCFNYKYIDPLFKHAVYMKLLGEKNRLGINITLHNGSIIAYGALGKRAGRILPELKDTPLWPNYFWDLAAEKNATIFDGSRITVPNPKLLKRGDIIICLPAKASIFEEVKQQYNSYGVNIIEYCDVLDLLAESLYSTRSGG